MKKIKHTTLILILFLLVFSSCDSVFKSKEEKLITKFYTMYKEYDKLVEEEKNTAAFKEKLVAQHEKILHGKMLEMFINWVKNGKDNKKYYENAFRNHRFAKVISIKQISNEKNKIQCEATVENIYEYNINPAYKYDEIIKNLHVTNYTAENLEKEIEKNKVKSFDLKTVEKNIFHLRKIKNKLYIENVDYEITESEIVLDK